MEDAMLVYGYRNKKSIGGVAIDAFVEEGHDLSAQVTSYPVEDGSTINDHVIQDPDKLIIRGVIGATSIYGEDALENTINRPYNIYLKLEELKNNGEPITVVTGLKTYENMVIEAFSITRNAENGRSLEFTMNLIQVRIVKSQLTALNIGGTTAVKRQAAPTTNKGKTQGTNLEEDDGKRTSFLEEIREKVRGAMS